MLCKFFSQGVASPLYQICLLYTSIVAVKTLSGCGPAAGEAIDSCGIPHIAASVAGDNTIFLLADDEKNIPEIMEKFQEMLRARAKND